MTRQFLEDLGFWIAEERKVALRILRLVGEVIRDPYQGTGKPEPLRHLDRPTWSRRVNEEHRLVYEVYPDRLIFLQCRRHYGG